MAKLQQDILRCQEVISELMIKHYDTNSYKEMVERIFKEIFKDYFECPDKVEPESQHLPEKSLEKIRTKFGIDNESL